MWAESLAGASLETGTGYCGHDTLPTVAESADKAAGQLQPLPLKIPCQSLFTYIVFGSETVPDPRRLSGGEGRTTPP